MSLRTLAHSALRSKVFEAPPLAALVRQARGWVRRNRGKKLRLQKEAALARHGAVSDAQLFDALRAAGIDEGDVLFVQASFKDMLTYEAKATHLLALLRRLVGESGTLLMPAYSTPAALGPQQVFDADTAPTYTGILNEIFRRSPGVVRSLHPRHSICGLGPAAAGLLAGHQRCAYADGAGSPSDRLRALDNAKILTLGLPPAFVSFLHWVEDVEPAKFPLPVHAPEPVERRVRLADGTTATLADHELRPGVAQRLALEPVTARLTGAAMRHADFKGIAVGVYPVKALAAELLALRDAGIVHYR